MILFHSSPLIYYNIVLNGEATIDVSGGEEGLEAGKLGALLQEELGGAVHLVEFGRGDGGEAVAKVRTLAHFDLCEVDLGGAGLVGGERDEVDLASFSAPVSGNDLVMALGKPSGDRGFGALADGGGVFHYSVDSVASSVGPDASSALVSGEFSSLSRTASASLLASAASVGVSPMSSLAAARSNWVAVRRVDLPTRLRM